MESRRTAWTLSVQPLSPNWSWMCWEQMRKCVQLWLIGLGHTLRKKKGIPLIPQCTYQQSTNPHSYHLFHISYYNSAAADEKTFIRSKVEVWFLETKSREAFSQATMRTRQTNKSENNRERGLGLGDCILHCYLLLLRFSEWEMEWDKEGMMRIIRFWNLCFNNNLKHNTREVWAQALLNSLSA